MSASGTTGECAKPSRGEGIDARYAGFVPDVNVGWWVLAAAVGLTLLIGVARWWFDGRFRPGPGAPPPDEGPAEPDRDGSRPRLTSADLDAALGERATLVHFSSAFCAPCRTTRQVLRQVSAAVPGVDHVEVDAESHLDLVRRLGIRRTPTVLVLDADGRIRARAAGLPRLADVRAVVDRVASRDDVS